MEREKFELPLRTGLAELVRVRPRQGRSGFLRLDMNENPEGLPSSVVRAIRRGVTAERLAMYPEPLVVTQRLAGRFGVTPEEIFLSNGSDEVIKSVFEVYGAAGLGVVAVAPTFEMYGVYAKMHQMELQAVPYRDDWSLPVSDVLSAIGPRTRIVALLNPNNPIGSVFTLEEARTVAVKAQSVGAVVVLDEAYHHFFEGTFLPLTREFPNVLLTRTFSKLWSLAGVRIGFAVGDADLLGGLEKVRQTFNVNAVALWAAEVVLSTPDLVGRLQRIEREGREFIIGQVRKSGHQWFAQNGNYIFIQPRRAPEELAALLEKRGILVKTYRHPLLAQHIRITTGSVRVMKQFWREFADLEARRV